MKTLKELTESGHSGPVIMRGDSAHAVHSPAHMMRLLYTSGYAKEFCLEMCREMLQKLEECFEEACQHDGREAVENHRKELQDALAEIEHLPDDAPT